MFRRLVKNIVLIVNLWFVLCLLVSGWVHLVNPAHFPMLAVWGLMFPLFVLVNVGFVVWWMLLRKAFFLISLIAILLFTAQMTNFIHFTCHNNTPNSNNIKVLSYNVRVFGIYDRKNKSKIRDSIFAFIRKESPDIACFQEYYNEDGNTFPVSDSLIHHQQFKHTHIHYTTLSKSKNYGIATFSRFPIINKGVISFKHTSNLAIYSDIVIKEDTIRVFNCHLQSLHLNKDDYQFLDDMGSFSAEGKRKGIIGIYRRMREGYQYRSEQALEIKKQMNQSPYPVMLCGDFNDTPSSFVYDRLSRGLSDSHRTNGYWVGSTWTRYFPGYRIDYILFSSIFECVGYKVPKVNYSDHRPIIGEYIIK